MFKDKTYWIIGASDGLGAALAETLTAQGARLILSARNADKLEAMAEKLARAEALPMDLTDTESVASALDFALDCDGVIYCAGNYEPMHAAQWDAHAAEMMVEVNFTGAMRVMSRIAPHFAERGRGHIALIGSLAAFRGLPAAVGYSASKAALVSLGETLYADLRHSGVKVQVISPGFIKTRLSDKNAFEMPQIMPPRDAADRTIKAMQGKRFHTAFPRPFAWLFTLGRFLPPSIFYKILGS